MKPLVPIIILVIVLLASGATLATRLTHLDLQPQKIFNQLESLIPTLAPSPTLPPFPSDFPLTATVKPTAKPTRKPTPKSTTTPKKVPAEETQTNCYRFTVTHLDGSTSRLCYSQENYQKLLTLDAQLKAAQQFYQFHLDGVNRYQQEYERTSSSIYLNAKARSQAQADEENDKIGQLSLKIYQLESQGK